MMALVIADRLEDGDEVVPILKREGLVIDLELVQFDKFFEGRRAGFDDGRLGRMGRRRTESR